MFVAHVFSDRKTVNIFEYCDSGEDELLDVDEDDTFIVKIDSDDNDHKGDKVSSHLDCSVTFDAGDPLIDLHYQITSHSNDDIWTTVDIETASYYDNHAWWIAKTLYSNSQVDGRTSFVGDQYVRVRVKTRGSGANYDIVVQITNPGKDGYPDSDLWSGAVAPIAIVGIVFGSVILCVIIITAIVCHYKCKHPANRTTHPRPVNVGQGGQILAMPSSNQTGAYTHGAYPKMPDTSLGYANYGYYVGDESIVESYPMEAPPPYPGPPIQPTAPGNDTVLDSELSTIHVPYDYTREREQQDTTITI